MKSPTIVSLFMCVALLASSWASPATAEEGPITPPRVHAEASAARAEIGLIAEQLGRPTPPPLGVVVRDASPREVLFQALVLYRKADRLAFEQTRSTVPEPELLLSREPRPGDVLAVVQAARSRLAEVRATLRIYTTPAVPDSDPAHTPTDVYLELLASSRELNSLLDRPFEPADVFQQVTVSMGYILRLLGRFDRQSRVPGVAPLDPALQPRDVFQRLADCHLELRGVGDALGVAMLELDTSAVEMAAVTPSDVFDLSALLVAEAAWLHHRQPGLAPGLPAAWPGPKEPPEVYQRAGLLLGLVQRLRALSEEEPARLNPGWSP